MEWIEMSRRKIFGKLTSMWKLNHNSEITNDGSMKKSKGKSENT
jgi:hypothetical protein